MFEFILVFHNMKNDTVNFKYHGLRLEMAHYFIAKLQIIL